MWEPHEKQVAAEAPMHPCISKPISLGQDENSNFEFVAEVRGYSKSQKRFPSSSPQPTKAEEGTGERPVPSVWLGAGVHESYVHFPGLRVRCHGREEILPHLIALEG